MVEMNNYFNLYYTDKWILIRCVISYYIDQLLENIGTRTLRNTIYSLWFIAYDL